MAVCKARDFVVSMRVYGEDPIERVKPPTTQTPPITTATRYDDSLAVEFAYSTHLMQLQYAVHAPQIILPTVSAHQGHAAKDIKLFHSSVASFDNKGPGQGSHDHRGAWCCHC